MIEEVFDVYLLKAFQRNFIKLDGNYVLLTDSGKKELEEIVSITYKLVNESNPEKNFLTVACNTTSQKVGHNLDPVEFFKAILKQMTGPSDARLLAFMMAEKEMNYKSLQKVIAEQNVGTEPKLSVVKGNKPRYDA